MNNEKERVFLTESYNFPIKDEVDNMKSIVSELRDAGIYTPEFAAAIYLGMINKEMNYIQNSRP
ncbi:hypothetical protein E1630_11635 [Salmonella enterica subsp. enterica serovar Baguida]|nr:hypothetical protein [Salmonella enterica subsp. enterica serovar Baguida]